MPDAQLTATHFDNGDIELIWVGADALCGRILDRLATVKWQRDEALIDASIARIDRERGSHGQ